MKKFLFILIAIISFNFLIISRVNATTIDTINGVVIDEEYIYNVIIGYDSNYNINDYQYIGVNYSSSTHDLFIVAFNSLSNIDYVLEYSNRIRLQLGHSKNAFAINYNIDNSTYSYSSSKPPIFGTSSRMGYYTVPSNDVLYISGIAANLNNTSFKYGVYYTNYSLNTDIATSTNITNISNYSRAHFNTLDFSGVGSLTFNPDLFENNPDFKKVCVNNYDTFSITTKQISDYIDDDPEQPRYVGGGFLWFPNGMRGLKSYFYTSNSSTGNYLDTSNTITWLNSKEVIDDYWSENTTLPTEGYVNKYDYYNYTSSNFLMSLTKQLQMYNVYYFDNPYIEEPNTLDTSGGGAGTSIDWDNKYCFYIQNEFDVNVLNKNVYGDFYTDIDILEDFNVSNSSITNENKYNSTGSPHYLFTNVNNFISRMSPTIAFINLQVYSFYLSLPLIVRSFLLACIVLLFTKFIIDMIVR